MRMGKMTVKPQSTDPEMHQKTPKIAPERCTFECSDVNEQACNLTDWQQRYDQVGAGRFHGRIDELRLGTMQVYREHSSHTLHQQCLVRPDAFWFGIPVDPEKCRINGQPLARHDILCRPGSKPFELVTQDRFDMLGIVVGKHELRGQEQVDAIDSLESGHSARLTLPLKTLTHLRYLIARMVEARPIDSHIHRDILLMGLSELLSVEQPNTSVAPSYRHRRQVVRRIQAHMEAASDLPTTMSELCEIGCVSRRTLQYSFESILGISPSQFLRVNRLNRVKRLLTDPGTTSVAEAASFYGFYHLSQFASDYKSLFGELPSQTRSRRSV